MPRKIDKLMASTREDKMLSDMKSLEKILIVRLSSIGDILHCSSVPRHLKKTFPQAEIHWLIRSDNAELLRFSPHLAKVIAFDRREGLSGWVKLCQKLRSENYSHIYDAHNNIRSRILSLILKPRHFIRRSKCRLKRVLLFWFKIDLFPKPYISTESYVTPLKPWGVESDFGGPEIHIAPEIFRKIENLTSQLKSFVVFAPATAWKKKNWPLDYWKALVKTVLEKTSTGIVILGGPQDRFCQDLILDSTRVISLQGSLSLLESAAVASLSKAFVVADTGLLHMTEALGHDVIGLLGPTPFGRPTRKTSQTLEVELWCRPCTKDGSGPCFNPVYQKCMKDISVANVFHTIEKMGGT